MLHFRSFVGAGIARPHNRNIIFSFKHFFCVLNKRTFIAIKSNYTVNAVHVSAGEQCSPLLLLWKYHAIEKMSCR